MIPYMAIPCPLLIVVLNAEMMRISEIMKLELRSFLERRTEGQKYLTVCGLIGFLCYQNDLGLFPFLKKLFLIPAEHLRKRLLEDLMPSDIRRRIFRTIELCSHFGNYNLLFLLEFHLADTNQRKYFLYILLEFQGAMEEKLESYRFCYLLIYLKTST